MNDIILRMNYFLWGTINQAFGQLFGLSIKLSGQRFGISIRPFGHYLDHLSEYLLHCRNTSILDYFRLDLYYHLEQFTTTSFDIITRLFYTLASLEFHISNATSVGGCCHAYVGR